MKEKNEKFVNRQKIDKKIKFLLKTIDNFCFIKIILCIIYISYVMIFKG